jgi:hydroxyisourate hydrolase
MKQPQGNWKELGRGVTDADGRCRQLLPSGALAAGTYRLIFDTASYFKSCNASGFYPQVSVEFEVRDSTSHYHVPLLLSPYGYSTYRGS